MSFNLKECNKILIFLLFFLSLFCISLFNTKYHLNDKVLKECLEICKPYLERTNSNHIFFINRIENIIENCDTKKSVSFAVLNDLSNQLIDRSEFYFSNAIQNAIKKSQLNNFIFLPSSFIFDKKNILSFYFLTINFFCGYAFFKRVKSVDLINKFIIIIFINSSLLASIGLLHKLNITNLDNDKILGIFETPESRYFFSTFTYKNHWSAFAILSSFTGIYIIRSVINYELYIFKNSKYLFMLLLFPLILSIPLSGSRSGVLILFICTLIYLFLSKYKSYIIIISSFFCVILFSLSKNSVFNEMYSTSKTQISNLEQGKLPLRVIFWKDAISQIKSSIWYGTGFNSYSVTNSNFQSRQVRDERNSLLVNAHTPYIPLTYHAHSDWLEWLCEWGIIGLFSIYVPILIMVLTIIYRNTNPSSKLFAISALSMLLYSVIDFPLRTPCNVLMLSITLAIAFRLSELKRN